jgi:ketosteroid isomerase-like protein
MEWRFEIPFGICLIVALALLLGACGSAPPDAIDRDAALRSLIEAERTFARTAQDRGYQAAFIEFFASDGIGFYPQPTNTRAFFSQRPPRADPPLLEWGPEVADVAVSGDLGYTAGPSRFLKAGTRELLSSGYFFSVWRREAGAWRVAVDAGISTPQARSDVPPERASSPATGSLLPLFSGKACTEVRAREQALSGHSAETVAATEKYVRLHRDGQEPIVGPEALARLAHDSPERLGWQRSYAAEACLDSASNDLAATWGSLAEGDQVRGYYIRTWRRDARGRWNIAADVANELPRK